LIGNTFSSVDEAFNEAKESALSSDLIFIGGSTFVVAEII
jgi:dihydrofolate synthase/folylpolyglutamate synthase